MKTKMIIGMMIACVFAVNAASAEAVRACAQITSPKITFLLFSQYSSTLHESHEVSD